MIPKYRKRKAVKKKEAEELGLPLRYGDFNPDTGKVFVRYVRNENNGSIYENWQDKEAYDRSYKKQLARMNRTMRFIKRVKTMFGCSICGYKKSSVALHFDHIDASTKYLEISRMYNANMQRLKNEMRKCQILCANCHAERTQEQRDKGELG
jgi:5-methylcytosine-specific restriction endonuclease McrA